ncbi:hypothetical protein ABZ721_31765 [Streptomyces sp. NPDC006733]|uniref:hypothetical protein n=1 Tax=Streptomyces sp. NPDC006733 TaxID=3155460 RepID=UPI0033D4A987
MSPIVYVDPGWLLAIQEEAAPRNVGIADWGALHWTGSAHRYEQIAGQPYYADAVSRAATFLHHALILRPFEDYNLVVGYAAADAYLQMSGQKVAAKPEALWSLAGAVRAGEEDLRGVARALRSWAI